MKEKNEIWKAINSLPGYEVNNFGAVRSYVIEIDKIRKKSKDGKSKIRYVTSIGNTPKTVPWIVDPIEKTVKVQVIQDSRLQSRVLDELIANAFAKAKPPEKGFVLAHENRKYLDFSEKNVIWKKKAGKKSSNKEKDNVEASDEKAMARAREIRWLLYKGISPSLISTREGISLSMISQIRNGVRCKKAGGPIGKNYFRSEEMDRACELALDHAKLQEMIQAQASEDESAIFKRMIERRNILLEKSGVSKDEFNKAAREVDLDLDNEAAVNLLIKKIAKKKADEKKKEEVVSVEVKQQSKEEDEF